MSIDWNKLNKINIRELTDSATKHLVVKTLIVQRLLLKYKGQNNYIRIYTEMPVVEKKVADVLFENIRTKECYAYEIQSQNTPKWRLETQKAYSNWQPHGFKTADWVLVDLNLLSENISELKLQLDKIIM
jgi:hypothetical protein